MKNHDTHNQYTKLRWSSIIMANEMTVMVFTQINFESERENFLFVTSKMVAIMQHYFTINASIMQDTSFHFIWLYRQWIFSSLLELVFFICMDALHFSNVLATVLKKKYRAANVDRPTLGKLFPKPNVSKGSEWMRLYMQT